MNPWGLPTTNHQPPTTDHQVTEQRIKRNTLILVLMAAVAGVGVYFIEGRSDKPADEEAEKAPTAFKFNREDVTGISLLRGGQTINFENKNNKWVITQPVNAAADESAVNTIAGDLVSARVEGGFPPPGGDLKQCGLSDPAVKLEVKLKNGSTHRVELGAKDPIRLAGHAQTNSPRET